MKKLLSLLTVAIITLGNNDALAQSRNEANVATLYRTSAAVDNARIHMATFDTNVKKNNGSVFDYNWENCQIGAELFQGQSGLKVEYWCEKGFYRE
ncbi:MAG: hypothetical protein HOI86_05020 [Tateyamaria sp.]|jgi:hypothetical protein|nr:hypothetical protein [Tateyamaria sp.]MCH9748111.1 hypothetical protein [Alphaproteobacteria bacterium]HAB39392.1 hypothetical protein [Paracoccaceae bacterium]MBT5301540.1 hypothetical protein [Tateyamaria sp.]MBT6267029.1 hypothetical protein [Tateyamaria sp.]